MPSGEFIAVASPPMLKKPQSQKRSADVIGMASPSKHDTPFPAQFAAWARDEIEEAAERLQYKSLRKVCREKLNARISYLSRAIDRMEKTKPKGPPGPKAGAR
jgi:hypothetical protein